MDWNILGSLNQPFDCVTESAFGATRGSRERFQRFEEPPTILAFEDNAIQAYSNTRVDIYRRARLSLEICEA
jgi:hypothetical protein